MAMLAHVESKAAASVQASRTRWSEKRGRVRARAAGSQEQAGTEVSGAAATEEEQPVREAVAAIANRERRCFGWAEAVCGIFLWLCADGEAGQLGSVRDGADGAVREQAGATTGHDFGAEGSGLVNNEGVVRHGGGAQVLHNGRVDGEQDNR